MPPPFYAVTFDLDGVLADSEPWWNQIDTKLLAEYGNTYRGEYHRNVLGVSYRVAVEFYKDAFHISASVEELMRRRGKIATDFFREPCGAVSFRKDDTGTIARDEVATGSSDEFCERVRTSVSRSNRNQKLILRRGHWR